MQLQNLINRGLEHNDSRMGGVMVPVVQVQLNVRAVPRTVSGSYEADASKTTEEPVSTTILSPVEIETTKG
jgi:hypothetical protein